MKRFQCHKQVNAAPITHIDGTKLLLQADDGEGVVPIAVSMEFIERHKPKPGDYFVEYEDGYTSISPASAFESGYAEIGEDADAPSGPAPVRGVMPVMRAKMYVQDIDKQFDGQETVTMAAVARDTAYPEDGSDEDNTYAKFSPSGRLTLTIANPALLGAIDPEKRYYLDFTEAPPKPAPVG